MKSLINDVTAFHLACDVPVSLTGPAFPPKDRLALRIKLETEEHEELLTAIEDRDMSGVADALADKIYISVGTAVEFGIPLDRVWNEVQRANMAKVDPVSGKVKKRADGKVLKPEGWTPPDILSALFPPVDLTEACEEETVSTFAPLGNNRDRLLDLVKEHFAAVTEKVSKDWINDLFYGTSDSSNEVLNTLQSEPEVGSVAEVNGELSVYDGEDWQPVPQVVVAALSKTYRNGHEYGERAMLNKIDKLLLDKADECRSRELEFHTKSRNELFGEKKRKSFREQKKHFFRLVSGYRKARTTILSRFKPKLGIW